MLAVLEASSNRAAAHHDADATAFALRSLDLVEARPLRVFVNGEHGLAGADVADHEARCPHAARYRGAEPGDKIVQRGLEVVCHLDGLLDLDPATLVEDLGDPRRVDAHVIGEAPLGLAELNEAALEPVLLHGLMFGNFQLGRDPILTP